VRAKRCPYIVVTALFLAVIMAPGLIQTVSELRDGERLGALEVFLRPPTARNLHAFERGLEASSLVVQRLRPWVQYFQWRFLADAGEKAVMGYHGWLFYRPGMRYLVERPAGASESQSQSGLPLRAIRSFRDQLHERGIRLLVVPVPNKESVYPEMLAKRAENAGIVVGQRTRRLLDELARYGIEHVDLFEVFRRAKLESSPSDRGRLYLADDSHWSPEGARAAARAVAARVLESGSVARGDRIYGLQPVTVRRLGDLIEMLHSQPIERAVEPESVPCLQVVQAGTRALYHDVAESEVLILGDSFLRIYEHDEPGAAGFVAHLARELGRPLATIVNDGGGATLVRRELARRPAVLANKRLVIWQFAEREIGYSTDGWQIVPLARSLAALR
jgi:hypothetical protein